MLIEEQLREMFSAKSEGTPPHPSAIIATSLTAEGRERLIAEIVIFVRLREKEALKKVAEGIYRGVLDSIDKGTLEGE